MTKMLRAPDLEEFLKSHPNLRVARPVSGKNAAAPDFTALPSKEGIVGVIPRPVAAAPETRQEALIKRSLPELRLSQQILAAGLPAPELEWFPVLGRGWRLDFAWPLMTPPRYVEVQGMAHRIKSKFHADMEKRAELTLSGWRGIEVSGQMIRDGVAIDLVRRLLA
jgi:hypothetical protein